MSCSLTSDGHGMIRARKLVCLEFGRLLRLRLSVQKCPCELELCMMGARKQRWMPSSTLSLVQTCRNSSLNLTFAHGYPRALWRMMWKQNSVQVRSASGELHFCLELSLLWKSTFNRHFPLYLNCCLSFSWMWPLLLTYTNAITFDQQFSLSDEKHRSSFCTSSLP